MLSEAGEGVEEEEDVAALGGGKTETVENVLGGWCAREERGPGEGEIHRGSEAGETFARGGFGDKRGPEAGGGKELPDEGEAGAGEDAAHFVVDAFGGDAADAVGVSRKGGEGGGLDGEAEAGGETDGAEEAEVIFGEAGGGVADGADEAGFEVGLAAVEIESVAGEGIEVEGVDGEVAAGGIVGGVGMEDDAGGAAAVLIAEIGAIGGDLEMG